MRRKKPEGEGRLTAACAPPHQAGPGSAAGLCPELPGAWESWHLPPAAWLSPTPAPGPAPSSSSLEKGIPPPKPRAHPEPGPHKP